MADKLDGKVAIVTDGSSGIGRATAIAFAQEGVKVIVTSIALLGANLLVACSSDVKEYAYEQMAAVQVRSSPASTSQDEQAIRKLIQEWAEIGFSPKDKTKEFKFQERLAKFYDDTPSRVVLHDNADPQMRIATSAEEYGKIWDGIFPKLRYLDNKVTNIHQVVIEGDLAVAVLSFDSTFIFSDGKKDIVPTLATLVWKRTADGWKIIQEHGSALKPTK